MEGTANNYSLLNVRIRPGADIHTFHTIILRTLHTIDSSSYGSVCQEQLIYSQWAGRRKGYSGEGLTEVSDEKTCFEICFGGLG
jgi:hypothetical protein